MLRVSQDWISYAGIGHCHLRPRLILYRNSHNLSVGLAEFGQISFQLNQLIFADASGVSPVKDQHHTLLCFNIIPQRDGVARSRNQVKIGRNR